MATGKLMSDAYKSAGVDIDAGNRLIEAIGPLARATARPGAQAALGGFGALFDLKAAGFKDPILVSGADGVGTKLKIAIECGIHNTIGIDLVAMCVNDVLSQGAEPLFFLDYFATGKLEEGTAESVVSGIAQGCLLANCALVGGETAEMPGMYAEKHYDLAGFCVGAAERDMLLPRIAEANDLMIGLESSGAHSNGYSLIRKIVSDGNFDYSQPAPFDTTISLGSALLEPTKIYVTAIKQLFSNHDFRAFAHITGGGLTENLPRVLPKNLEPDFDDRSLEFPPLFQWIKETGQISNPDMYRTFNCGIGGVVIASPISADRFISVFEDAGVRATVIGTLKEKS